MCSSNYCVLWQTFNEIQKLLSKTNGKVVGDLMTPSPLVVHESTSLEDAARYRFGILIKTIFFLNDLGNNPLDYQTPMKNLKLLQPPKGTDLLRLQDS